MDTLDIFCAIKAYNLPKDLSTETAEHPRSLFENLAWRVQLKGKDILASHSRNFLIQENDNEWSSLLTSELVLLLLCRLLDFLGLLLSPLLIRKFYLTLEKTICQSNQSNVGESFFIRHRSGGIFTRIFGLRSRMMFLFGGRQTSHGNNTNALRLRQAWRPRLICFPRRLVGETWGYIIFRFANDGSEARAQKIRSHHRGGRQNWDNWLWQDSSSQCHS